ncbi:ribosomal protein S18 acetylase RimI-like enzyme [Kribbella steppae]|uniref:Ribosomal protein S18 acetylase RimI-like enzyme n=1 Tax=Kribbella steppae TaxID=2512223 RepID=A0A4R2HL56_9ACTN|nr:GNAT family N-acetyltransferase [Kribbella steppae]TCO30465.1 ribosomal protein S18 acetylase RimI-like enzyme [Kribbella steppae]
MLIRPVRESDIESLHRNRLCGLTIEETAELVMSATDEEHGDESRFLVAVAQGGGVVGMTTVKRLKHRMCRHRAELGGFVILPVARGTGLARRIVDAASRHAGDWGCSILEVSCRGGTHAEKAYVGLGFQVWGQLPGGFHDHDGLVFDEVRLWMSLPTKTP